jgi:type II secretory pathway predicted ATPase ExeA
MTVQNELREERNDVFSFWIDDQKVCESTLIALTAAQLEAQQKLDDINTKISLIESL